MSIPLNHPLRIRHLLVGLLNELLIFLILDDIFPEFDNLLLFQFFAFPLFFGDNKGIQKSSRKDMRVVTQRVGVLQLLVSLRLLKLVPLLHV